MFNPLYHLLAFSLLHYLSKVVSVIFGDVNTTEVVVVGGGGGGVWLLIREKVEACWPTGAEVLQEAVDEAGDCIHLWGRKGEKDYPDRVSEEEREYSRT